jgi:hypothetical protein
MSESAVEMNHHCCDLTESLLEVNIGFLAIDEHFAGQFAQRLALRQDVYRTGKGRSKS